MAKLVMPCFSGLTATVRSVRACIPWAEALFLVQVPEDHEPLGLPVFCLLRQSSDLSVFPLIRDQP